MTRKERTIKKIISVAKKFADQERERYMDGLDNEYDSSLDLMEECEKLGSSMQERQEERDRIINEYLIKKQKEEREEQERLKAKGVL